MIERERYDPDWFACNGVFYAYLFSGGVEVKHAIEVIPSEKSVVRYICDDKGLFKVNHVDCCFETESVELSNLEIYTRNGAGELVPVLKELWW